jgi:hypothetical protein
MAQDVRPDTGRGNATLVSFFTHPELSDRLWFSRAKNATPYAAINRDIERLVPKRKRNRGLD